MAQNQLVIDLPGDDQLGPRMLALNEQQRRFVFALMHFDTSSAAALAAGYSERRAKQTGWDLMHEPKILDAISEVNRRRLSGLSVKAVSQLAKILDERDHPRHHWAIDAVLNRTGYSSQTEHKIHVDHSLDELQVKAVAAQMALQLGVDQRTLLGGNEPLALEAVEVDSSSST
jgi:phage terminase small subunit